jgi:hypothetical protein
LHPAFDKTAMTSFSKETVAARKGMATHKPVTIAINLKPAEDKGFGPREPLRENRL